MTKGCHRVQVREGFIQVSGGYVEGRQPTTRPRIVDVDQGVRVFKSAFC